MDNTQIEKVEGEVIETSGMEDVSENTDDTPKGKSYPTQAVLTIRAIVGGYVLYLAYQIATSESEKSPLIWAAVALFVVAGAALVIMSIKHFICKEYEGAKDGKD